MSQSFLTAFLCVAVAVFCMNPCAAAQDATVMLPAHQSLVDADLVPLTKFGNVRNAASTDVVDVAGPGGADVKAIRIDVAERQQHDYSIQLRRPVEAVFKKGDVVWMSAFARVTRTRDESGLGWMDFVLEQSKDPWDKVIQRRVSVPAEWLQICVPARVSKDFAAGELSISLRVGAASQTLEIADVRLVKFDDPKVEFEKLPQTRVTYAGREADAPWRAEADKRIDEIRKAPLTVRVVDAAGQPVKGAAVTVTLKRHAFPFGSVYNVSPIVGDRSQTSDGLKYQQTYTELFNYGVDEYAMKWPAWENEQNREKALKSLEWMTQRGIKVRGHCLVWPSWRFTPASLKQLANDPAALRQRIADHIASVTQAFAGKVTEWDVINEPYNNNDLMKILGYEEMAEWFKLARKGDPTARLYLNETSVPTSPLGDIHYDTLYEHAQLIQKNGGDLGGVGMQAHFGSVLTPPEHLKKIYDRFAGLGVPVQITELDIDVHDEQVQADYMRDFLTMSFSHANINGIMLWGFWAKQHWRPSAAFYTADWKLRPIGQAWIDLVHKKWKTNETGTTDEKGVYAVRGFLGEYDVTVTVDGKSTSVTTTLANPAAEWVVKLN